MKKNMKSYGLIWLIFLAAFNAVVFLVRPIIPGYVFHYDIRFWISWLFIVAAFVGNLICANKAFQAKNLEKLFYKVPLITVSYTGLIVMLVLGGGMMLIPNCPAWIAAVICVIVAAFTAVAVVKADWAAAEVSATQEKVQAQTQFIKLLTTDAEALLDKAKTQAAKAAAKQVYEALRYSDPVSNAALADMESQIALSFNGFSNAVANDAGDLATLADELVVMIGDRNKKCKGTAFQPCPPIHNTDVQLRTKLHRLSRKKQFGSSSKASGCFMFMYFLLPHWVPAT